MNSLLFTSNQNHPQPCILALWIVSCQTTMPTGLLSFQTLLPQFWWMPRLCWPHTWQTAHGSHVAPGYTKQTEVRKISPNFAMMFVRIYLIFDQFWLNICLMDLRLSHKTPSQGPSKKPESLHLVLWMKDSSFGEEMQRIQPVSYLFS